MWITDVKQDDLEATTDIQTADCLLISRADIQTYLEEEGYNQEMLAEKADEIRSEGKENYIEARHDKFFYYLTPFLSERPLNIVMSYEILSELAEETYTIDNTDVHTGTELFD